MVCDMFRQGFGLLPAFLCCMMYRLTCSNALYVELYVLITVVRKRRKQNILLIHRDISFRPLLTTLAHQVYLDP
jgi:hypothetical protein